MPPPNPKPNPRTAPQKATPRPGGGAAPLRGDTSPGKPHDRLSPALPGPSATPANPVDKALVQRAYRKLMEGQDLTRDERALVKRHEKEKEEQLRWRYYASIPQKHWRTMSGRQTKVINEQAARYGLPFGGPTVNLPALARALHDFLADNAWKLSRDEDPLMSAGGSSSPALERYREERAALARLDRLQREGDLLPRDQVRAALGQIASLIRGAGDALARQFGAAAVEILEEALDDAAREVERAFGEGASSEKHEPEQEDGPVLPDVELIEGGEGAPDIPEAGATA